MNKICERKWYFQLDISRNKHQEIQILHATAANYQIIGKHAVSKIQLALQVGSLVRA